MEDLLALAWDACSSPRRDAEEALQIGVALFPGFGLHAVWVQKHGIVWRQVTSGGVRCETDHYEAKLIGAKLTFPLMYLLAAYAPQPRVSVWRMVRAGITPGPALLQKITAADIRKLMDDTELGSPRLPRLDDLAWRIEHVRRCAVVATAIEKTLLRCRANHDRVVEAKAILCRHLQSIIKWSVSAEEGNQGDFVRDARARLASLDQIPGTAPLPRLELAWHGAAVGLADCFVRDFGFETARWYRAGPGIRFVRQGLDMIGLEPHEPGAIERVIRQAGF